MTQTGTETLSKVVTQMNSLLRGEISAVETYEIALSKIASGRSTDEGLLRAIAQEHGVAAQRLRALIVERGGDADDSSGAWGVYAKTVEGAASLFGDTSALKALKEGEEHGLKDFRDALDSVDDTARRVLDEELIPNLKRHISALDAMIDRTSKSSKR